MLLAELMYSHGRLPPLQAIGRTTAFDKGTDTSYFDQAANDQYGTGSEHSFTSEIEEQTFGLPDGELAAKVLQRSFRLLEPGSHVCKKTPEHGGSSFVHCTNGMSVARQYGQLRHLMEEQAKLEFVRDYVFRIKSLTAFVKDLENLVNSEYRTWYTIMHNSLTEAPNSKLYCLTTVCEDLRIHINHWNCVKQRWHTDHWLKAAHKQLCFELDLVQQTLSKLRDAAIWWVERLIKVGLEVFANSDAESMTHEMLWNITRGLEEYNSVVMSVHFSTCHEASKHLFPALIWQDHQGTSRFNATRSNSVAQMGGSLRPIPLIRVLSIIASERARYAALKAYRFFTTSDGFVTLTHEGRLPTYSWTSHAVKRVGSRLAPISSAKSEQTQDTSDYYTASSRSTVSVNAALLQVGEVVAPDLSSAMHPLMDFIEQEQDFIDRVLHVVCSSTNLLRKNGPGRVGTKSSKGYRSSAHPPRGPVDESALVRTDLKRKCVSWGDSADTSIRLQVASRYMDVLWQSFGTHLELAFQDAIWGLDEDYVDTELGGITLCNDMAVMILRQLIEHACLKDLFPSVSWTSLMAVRQGLHCSAALNCWQSALCSVMGSFTSDKCYPCPLVDGEYSMKTGMLLRDSFQPLLSLLSDESTADHVLSKGAVPKPRPDLAVVVELCSRLLVTCRLSHHWCYTKAHQFLSSWTVSSFLLVTQTDLKILVDETKHAVWLTQTVLNMFIGGSGTPLENPLVQELSTISQDLHSISGQLQMLSGASMKLFSTICGTKSGQVFQDVMPVSKIWRKKNLQDCGRERSAYVEQVLDCILEPVIDGVCKLKATSQLGTISLATVAMCDAWTDFILKEKIKFSLAGAHQLSLDFTFVRTWLSQNISNVEVRQSLLELTVFSRLNGIIQLLMKQPRRKARETGCSIEDLNCENSVHTESMQGSSETVTTPLGYCDDGDNHDDRPEETDICHIQNVDSWLALRLNNPARWRLSSCFTGQTTGL